jgi:hypothetical protein
LRLTANNECALNNGAASSDVQFIVPPAQGTAGPAVKFFANVGANNLKTTTRAQIFPVSPMSPASLDIPETGQYAESRLCLPPGLIGRRATLRLQLADSDGGGCATSYPDELAFIDDVSVTTDPACAAQ